MENGVSYHVWHAVAVASRIAARAWWRLTRPTCMHRGWRFETHGRRCPDCGVIMVDPGD
jgi:tRNA(Ile2) C34 agmatinyltransferase TiaS